MATQQIERPLSEVDETTERIQGRTAAGWDEPTADRPREDRPSWDAQRALEIVQRVARDPASLLRAAILAVGLVILVTVVWSRRRPPRTREEVLLERSREAFERGRETLETIASRLSAIDR
jgi:hypothetical protein